ncbi:Spy/CpxP family protein refolding chaperone [Leucothrix arctica]|uniref:Uncharacterized protein n=1 Tax=Leucothrix arctica TaxID=1481894 RepID=A0A317CFI8_9GAMM|nr:hypothetical protein [Leucothrix arctica]PWQ96163.1 hypothetical protein DKT75_09200 [Leucothrix arctica]
MKNVILVTLLASTLGLGAAAVHANDTTGTQGVKTYAQSEDGKHKGKRSGRRGGMIKHMTEALSLTEAQVAQMKSLREANKGTKGSKDKAARKAGREQFETQFKAILTPEQLVKLEALHSERGGKHGGKRGQKHNAE